MSIEVDIRAYDIFEKKIMFGLSTFMSKFPKNSSDEHSTTTTTTYTTIETSIFRQVMSNAKYGICCFF